jgi:hypothetical protein
MLCRLPNQGEARAHTVCVLKGTEKEVPVSTNQKDDLLRKIAGLLAKAEQTEFEGERLVFMQKADELMAKYQIELWELSQRDAGRIDLRQPVIRDFDYAWAFSSGPFPEICEALWSLFISTASHTTCTIVYHKQHYSGERGESAGYVVPVVGTEADLGYMTLLFTSLMTQLIEATHPKADRNISYEENLCRFREAGFSWPETAKAMQVVGWHVGEDIEDARHKCAHAYRRYVKRMGIEQNYNHYKTYRRNFSHGFAERVNVRFHQMRRETAEHVGTGMELALTDQRKINREFIEDEFGMPSNRRSRSLSTDNRRYDSAAMNAGREAGNRANISVNPSHGLKGRKSLGK